MKTYLIYFGLFFLFACKQGNKSAISEDSSIDSLSAINNDLSGELQSKDVIIEGFLKSFNQIQENLNLIKIKEKKLTLTTDVELKKSQHEQIISDIQFINDLLDRNRAELVELNKKLKNSDKNNAELQKTVSNLNNQVRENEEEINYLKNRLSSLNIKMNNVNQEYSKEKKASAAKTEKLNTVYCTIGTADDLKEKGIITKRGGFIGLGKVKDLDPNLSKGMFSEIDIYQTKEIAIAAKNVTIITEHAASSYKLEGKYGIKTLNILDPDEFWKTSKYLVIQVSAEKPKKEGGAKEGN